MSFLNRISSIYPSVSWKGCSSIHTSIFDMLTVVPSDSVTNQGQCLALLSSLNTSDHLYSMLTSTFNNFEYLVTMREFKIIFLDDVLRHLKSQGDAHTDGKLLNPSTGNVFNLIARDDDLVAGIRYWLVGSSEGIKVYFRFRITTIQECKTTTTERIKLVCDEAETNLEEVGISVPYDEEPIKLLEF